MKQGDKKTRFKMNSHQIIHVGIAAAVILSIFIGGVCAVKYGIDYNWGWERTPQYFFYNEVSVVYSDIDGRVKKITENNDIAEITIKGKKDTTIYQVSAKSLLVTEYDLIVQGYKLGMGVGSEWKAGVVSIGIGVTLAISFFAIIFGFFFSILGGIIYSSKISFLKYLMTFFIESASSIPVLWHIIIWYYVIGTVIHSAGISMIDKFWLGVIALAVYSGTNIIKSVKEEIHLAKPNPLKGDIKVYFKIILLILPSVPRLSADIIKDSSLLGLIAMYELTRTIRDAQAASLMVFEFTILCVGIYFVIVFTLYKIMSYMSIKITRKYAITGT